MSDNDTKHTPTADIKNDHIVEQFARSLVSHHMGEAWKWQDGEYEMTVKCLREKIVRAVNNFDQMLATLKLCFEEWPERFTPCYRELKEAIAKAEARP